MMVCQAVFQTKLKVRLRGSIEIAVPANGAKSGRTNSRRRHMTDGGIAEADCTRAPLTQLTRVECLKAVLGAFRAGLHVGASI